MSNEEHDVRVLYGEEAEKALRGRDDTLTALASVLEQSFVDASKEPDEFRLSVDKQRARMQRLLSNGRAAVIQSEGEIASFTGHEYIGISEDGRPVYELGSVVTLPQSRGKGFGSRALQRCVDGVRVHDANALFMMFTKDPDLISWCEKRKAQPLNSDALVAIYRRGGAQFWEDDLRTLEDRWKPFSKFLVDFDTSSK